MLSSHNYYGHLIVNHVRSPVCNRSVRLLLLRHQAQLVGSAGGRGRENRTENEIAAEPAAGAAADSEDHPRSRSDCERCCCRRPRSPWHRYRRLCGGREDRTEEAD